MCFTGAEAHNSVVSRMPGGDRRSVQILDIAMGTDKKVIDTNKKYQLAKIRLLIL